MPQERIPPVLRVGMTGPDPGSDGPGTSARDALVSNDIDLVINPVKFQRGIGSGRHRG